MCSRQGIIECISAPEMNEAICAWVSARIPGNPKFGPEVKAIGVLRDREPVVGCTYHTFTGWNIVCDIAVAPGFSMTRGVLRTLFSYPLITLGCRRITVYVARSNTASQAFVERLGFMREGTIRDETPDGDYFLYGLLKKDCPWT